MNNLHSYSLSLILDESGAGCVRDLSRSLKLNFGEFIPHVTIITSSSQLEQSRFSGDRVTICARNIYFGADDQGRIWVGLAIDKTESLTELYKQASLSVGLSYDIDKYFPHITLGCSSKDSLKSFTMRQLYKSSKKQTFQNCVLAACQNGEYGKVVEAFN